MLTTRAGEASRLFDRYRVLVTADGEEAAANALRVNDRLFVGSRFPGTIALLEEAGYALVALDTHAIGLIDAGLSCMSLRWAASREPR